MLDQIRTAEVIDKTCFYTFLGYDFPDFFFPKEIVELHRVRDDFYSAKNFRRSKASDWTIERERV